MNDTPDPEAYPECQWDAEVRLGDQLCLSERAFLKERKRKMKAAFAELFEVPESEIEEEDLPIVAIAGSGGGQSLLYSLRWNPTLFLYIIKVFVQ